MSSERRPIDALVGVYNANGGIAGELRYIAAKIGGRGHCSLCDLTHRGISRRREWGQVCSRLSTPFELVHLNERTDPVRLASGDSVPCVLARVGDELITLLRPAELDQCAADVDEFERRLRTAAASHELAIS